MFFLVKNRVSVVGSLEVRAIEYVFEVKNRVSAVGSHADAPAPGVLQ